jgi:hypothetical protein
VNHDLPHLSGRAFVDIDQHTLQDQARHAWRLLCQADRTMIEDEAAGDLAALTTHLHLLGIKPVAMPLIDDDATVVALIYRTPDRSERPKPGVRGVQIWACARDGRIWLRRADGDHDAIDDEADFRTLADLGRVLDHGAVPAPAPDLIALATELLTEASISRGLRGLRLALTGLGLAFLAQATQQRRVADLVQRVMKRQS